LVNLEAMGSENLEGTQELLLKMVALKALNATSSLVVEEAHRGMLRPSPGAMHKPDPCCTHW
jgi:hypothetical protein